MKKCAKGTPQKRKVGDPSVDQGKVVESSDEEGKSFHKRGKRPLGRPRIHPVKEGPLRPRGRPRKIHKNSMSDFPLPSATASRSAVLAANSSSPVSPATAVSPRPGQGPAYPSDPGSAPLTWAAAEVLRCVNESDEESVPSGVEPPSLKRHRSVCTSPAEEPPSWRRYHFVGTSPAEEPWVTAAPLTPSRTLSARTASATSRWVVRAGSPITGANAPTSSALSIDEVADGFTPSAADAAARSPIFASPSCGDAVAVADNGPSRVDAAAPSSIFASPSRGIAAAPSLIFASPSRGDVVAFAGHSPRADAVLPSSIFATPSSRNAVAATESVRNPAGAAAEMSSLFSAPVVAPNVAFIDNEFGEPQGVKRAKELARERNLVHLSPWITEDAFPTGQESRGGGRSQECQGGCRSQEGRGECSRKKADEEATRKKAEEQAARKKIKEDAARKKAKRRPRKKAEKDAARKKAEEEAARKKAEREAVRKRAEEEVGQKKAQREAARKRAEEEAAGKKAEEEEPRKKA
ncbi:hypothetical protein BDK51DRAFT_28870 [Blyttiomyces helicus]|uniref:Uncharacterized protein n=1 Tax=Blyttiomyces helicus TaxID=388810 RepID=A0A4P9W0M0_9FUNG|nr:hypothetical protein BDK51DRAFT_28870 [Blyttiomyces helicus]|eukprot:RKO83576.1 hypothetical protein BDK51DRAFT_28870 [Blyttiomyces helicus]